MKRHGVNQRNVQGDENGKIVDIVTRPLIGSFRGFLEHCSGSELTLKKRLRKEEQQDKITWISRTLTRF